MVALNERLPCEIVIWFLEHGNLDHLPRLTTVAFEKSQLRAYSYSEVVTAALVLQFLIYTN